MSPIYLAGTLTCRNLHYVLFISHSGSTYLKDQGEPEFR
jgi:hypothetical protein